MKPIRYLIIALALGLGSVAYQGCQQAPSARVIQYQTLRGVGEAGKSSMDATTQLLKQGSITYEQWQKVATFYDTKFQPAYAVAVVAAQSDLSSVASPDLTNLLNQLLALTAALTTH